AALEGSAERVEEGHGPTLSVLHDPRRIRLEMNRPRPRATERGRRWRCRNRTPSSPVHGGGRRRRRRGPVTPLHLVNPRVLLAPPRPAQGPPETRPTARPALRRASAAAPACGGRVARECAPPRDG